MISIGCLPTVNAVLNGVSAFLLILGFYFIRRKRVKPHRVCMVAAFSVSVLFLVSYLTYHFYHGATRFAGQGWVRPLYFGVLLSHTVLAAVIVPLVLITLTRALRGRFDSHRRLARWTWPLWLYVSLTGIVVYVMLYHLYRATP